MLIYFGHTAKHVGSFPDQGLNPCSLHWKHRVLTTGAPVKSRRNPLLIEFVWRPSGIWMSISLFRFGNFLAIISLILLSSSFSLCSLYDNIVMKYYFTWCCPIIHIAFFTLLSWIDLSLSMFPYSLLSFLQIISFLPDNLHISISLRFSTEKLLCSFGNVMFSWFFMFFKVLYCCFHIQRSSNLLHSLPAGFGFTC